MPRTKDQKDRNVGGTSKSGGRDMGKDTKGPSFSVKGFTSKDPANVARNREGASRYASKSERIAASGRDGNADKAAAQAAYRAASARPVSQTAANAAAAAAASKKAPMTAAPKPGMVATGAPAGYRPGIDPEFNYRTGVAGTPRAAPTVTLAKGGKAKGKKK